MDVSENTQPAIETVNEQNPIDSPYSNLSDSQRKQVKLTQQAQSLSRFLGIVINGISKIVQEVSSAILKR